MSTQPLCLMLRFEAQRAGELDLAKPSAELLARLHYLLVVATRTAAVELEVRLPSSLP